MANARVDGSRGFQQIGHVTLPDGTVRLAQIHTIDLPNDSVTLSSKKPRREEKVSWMRAFFGAGMDMVKGVFSLKGLATMGVAWGLTLATGGAALPFLIALGMGLSALQIGQGAGLYLNGNLSASERELGLRKIFGGLFNVGLSVGGARAFQKGGAFDHVLPKSSLAKSVLADGKQIGPIRYLWNTLTGNLQTARTVVHNGTPRTEYLSAFKASKQGLSTQWSHLSDFARSEGKLARLAEYATGRWQTLQNFGRTAYTEPKTGFDKLVGRGDHFMDRTLPAKFATGEGYLYPMIAMRRGAQKTEDALYDS